MRAVAAGRLIAGIRTKLAIVSGSTRMPVHRYVIADAIGAAVWAVSVGLLGYLFSSSVDSLDRRFGNASHVLGVIAIAIAAVAAVYLSVRYVLRPPPGADRAAGSAGDRLQHRVGDVEVGVHVLDVVVLLERVDQPQQLAGGILLERDRVLRHQRQLGRA